MVNMQGGGADPSTFLHTHCVCVYVRVLCVCDSQATQLLLWSFMPAFIELKNQTHTLLHLSFHILFSCITTKKKAHSISKEVSSHSVKIIR